MTDFDRLDRELIEAGTQWRAEQAPAPPIGAVWRAPRAGLSIRGGLALLAATVVVAISAAALGGGGHPTASSPNGSTGVPSNVVVAWDAEQLEAAAIHPGDLVTASGVLTVKAGEGPKLCAGALDILMFGVPPSCSLPAVPLSGAVDVGAIPKAKTVATTTFAANVKVHGRWTGSSIQDPTIGTASPRAYEADLPCVQPPGGWASPSASFRAALDPLARDIADHPELYAGYYTLSVHPGDSVPAVEVVRTRVDPRTLASRVAALFPYAVCLTRDYPQADLDAATFAFTSQVGAMAQVAGDTHRVNVQIEAIDDTTLPLFLRYPAAYPVPLVTRSAPAALPGLTSQPIDSPSTQPSVAPGELPAAIDGRPVLVGDAALAAFLASTDDTRMLVGGWVAAPVPMSCPVLISPNPFWVCSGVFLHAGPFGGPIAMVLHFGSSDVSIPPVGSDEVVPVVFEVHTHDGACVSPLTDCLLAPVVDRLVWSGPVEPIPSPTSTMPPNGIREATAKALAVSAAAGRARSSFPLVAVSAHAGHYAEVGPPGSNDIDGDRWVWAVVVSGMFIEPDCATNVTPCNDTRPTSSLVVLDYVTGEVLIQETPAPLS